MNCARGLVRGGLIITWFGKYSETGIKDEPDDVAYLHPKWATEAVPKKGDKILWGRVEMFSKETIEKNKQMFEEWEKQVAGIVERKLKGTTLGGLPLKPIYTPADIADTKNEDIPICGQYPYTRANNPVGYQIQPWVMRHGYGFGQTGDSRKRKEFFEALGGAYHVGERPEEKPFPFTILLDLSSQCGYDPDAPEARGRVGECGASISNMWDLEELFDGNDIEKTEVIFITPNASLSFIAQYIVYAENRGIPTKNLRLKACNIFYHQWFWDTASFPPELALRQGPELIKYLHENVPLAELQSITGYNMGEAGATPIMEVAFTIATAMLIVEECLKVGLKPDDILPRFYGHDLLSTDIFETVAKFRAKRRMWAKIFRERFGCQNPKSLILRNYPQTAGSLLTAQEPENNIIRAALMTLAGILAGVNGIWTASYDEALNIPSEQAAKLALRTHQIMYHETNIPAVSDPLGGSYYVEWLTNKIEEEAYRLLDEVEKKGGYLKCWKDGWFRRLLAEASRKREDSLNKGDRVVVGVNKYVVEEKVRNAMFRVDPEVERKAIERVKKFREQRNSKETEMSLAGVREAARMIKENWPDSCGMLMPALIEAFRAKATIGEVHGVLKEVWGYGYSF
jgi:methylmalonyl-CoA mutase N-terminal domain/subunit